MKGVRDSEGETVGVPQPFNKHNYVLTVILPCTQAGKPLIERLFRDSMGSNYAHD